MAGPLRRLDRTDLVQRGQRTVVVLVDCKVALWRGLNQVVAELVSVGAAGVV